jgi:AraC-like DNA-binding protein
MREIVRASAWDGFRQLVDELGGNSAEILAAAHVDVAALTDPEHYLPLRTFIDSQEIAAERLGRPDFGLMFGGKQTLSVLGALSIAIANSSTPRQAIEICARYLHVHNPAVTMALAPVPRTSREFLDMHLDMRRPARREQNSERTLSSIHKTLRQLGGPAYKPLQVWFLHAPLSPMSTYRKVFGVTPLFNRPRMGMSIERSILDNWRPGVSSQLRQIAETYLRQISPPRQKSFTIRVAGVARSLLRGKECTPEQAARALGIHPRTLQRRLRSEGTTFEKIKDDIRRETAESLLAQPSVSLSQIALMLDYADSSAFSRSSRRWFGEAPTAVRRRLVAGKQPRPAPHGSRVRSFEAKLLARAIRG